jgi:hypothetical protein
MTENERLRDALARAAERFKDAADLIQHDYDDANAAEFMRASAKRCQAVLAGGRFDDPLGGRQT